MVKEIGKSAFLTRQSFQKAESTKPRIQKAKQNTKHIFQSTNLVVARFVLFVPVFCLAFCTLEFVFSASRRLVWYTVSMKRTVIRFGSFLVAAVMLAGFLGVFAHLTAFAEDPPPTQDQIDSTQSQYDKTAKKLQAALDKQASLQKELSQIGSSLSVTQQAIATAKIKIEQAANDIERKQAEIEFIEAKIAADRDLLGELLRQMYDGSIVPEFSVVLTEEDAVRALNNPDQLMTVGQRINGLLGDIHDSHDQADTERQNLEALKATHEQLLAEKTKQKNALVADQQSTQSDLQDQQATVAELQKKLQKLRDDLSSLLGENVSTDDVKKAAGIASDATGVRKSFILAELTQESGMGHFTGGCTYKNTRVKVADATVFKQIMKELGYDINSHKISCAPKDKNGNYKGYGGAMGIAQFMPTTWIGYKSYIAGATGHNPPDPWSVIDGVMGMAKKLANGGATSKKGEYNASMLYYCGTTHPVDTSAYPTRKEDCNNYAKSVQNLAKGFENN